MAADRLPRTEQESGLFLEFPNGESLALTYATIEARVRAILADPRKIPARVRDAEAFQLCAICPKQGSAETCHAIRPVIAVWDEFDHYMSFDSVTARYRAPGADYVTVAHTTVQDALQFVSVLSLCHYCELGKQYWRCFHGVHPLMRTDELVARVFLNMFWVSGGDMERTRRLAARFRTEIATTARCQMNRIRLFCHTDSFLNALILTDLASQLLVLDVEDLVNQQLDAFDNALPG